MDFLACIVVVSLCFETVRYVTAVTVKIHHALVFDHDTLELVLLAAVIGGIRQLLSSRSRNTSELIP